MLFLFFCQIFLCFSKTTVIWDLQLKIVWIFLKEWRIEIKVSLLFMIRVENSQKWRQKNLEKNYYVISDVGQRFYKQKFFEQKFQHYKFSKIKLMEKYNFFYYIWKKVVIYNTSWKHIKKYFSYSFFHIWKKHF